MNEKARPMKEQELREHAVCSLCDHPIGTAGVPIFYRLKIDTFALDLNALQRQQGLTMQLGGHAVLAAVMGPDQDMAQPIGETSTLTVCQHCAINARYPVAFLIEAAAEAKTGSPDEESAE